MTPTGIIMQSSSVGATQEAIEKVLTDNGYEPEKAAPVEAVEPKRDDFESDEAFETAQQEFEEKQAAAGGNENETDEEREEKEERARAAREVKTSKPLSRRQRAIARETRKLQDDLRAANDRIAALEGKGGGGNRETQTVKAPELPKREAFKSDAEFDEAMFDYRYQLRRAKEVAANAQAATEAQLKENYENYKSGVEDFKEEHDDWDEVVGSKTPIHESVYLAIIELENGPAVTYYLGKHPDYAKRLAEKSPLAAVVEVGRLSDRLKTGAPNRGEADGTTKPKPKTRLPEPVRPVSTAATSSTMTSAEAAKKRDFRAFKTAQRAGR
jgi:hypothetical protein